MKDKVIKFDVVNFANNPAEWNKLRENIKDNIKFNKDFLAYLEEQIRNDFSNFNVTDFFNNCKRVAFYIYIGFDNELNKLVYSARFHVKVLKVNFELKIEYPITYKTKEHNGVIYDNWGEFEDNYKTKYKKELIKLFSLLSYKVGCSEMLIQETDIIIKFLQNRRLKNGFKSLVNVNLVKKINSQLRSFRKDIENLRNQNKDLNLAKINYEQEIDNLKADLETEKNEDFRDYEIALKRIKENPKLYYLLFDLREYFIREFVKPLGIYNSYKLEHDTTFCIELSKHLDKKCNVKKNYTTILRTYNRYKLKKIKGTNCPKSLY